MLKLLSLFGLVRGNALLAFGAMALDGLDTYQRNSNLDALTKRQKSLVNMENQFREWAFGPDYAIVDEAFWVLRWNLRHGNIAKFDPRQPLEQNVEKMLKIFLAKFYPSLSL